MAGLTRIIAERLDGVAALGGRIHGSGKLDALRGGGATAQTLPAAFVVPGGIRARDVEAMTGLFAQGVDRIVSVVLAWRDPGTLLAAKAVDSIEPLVETVIERICGWAPEELIGDFRLARGELLAMQQGGVLIYQLDFAVEDQLRITPQ